MSPHLKPLLLPQLVEERRKIDSQASLDGVDLSHVYYTTNSSSSDVASPVTPTFSPRGHQRFPSSSSSLELPPQPQQESPASPTAQYLKSEKRQLPDVQEDPMELYEDDSSPSSEHFGLYSCLCKSTSCTLDPTPLTLACPRRCRLPAPQQLRGLVLRRHDGRL